MRTAQLFRAGEAWSHLKDSSPRRKNIYDAFGSRKPLRQSFAQQQQQVEALTATVQKVSNQLELNKAAQQVVASNQ